MERFQKRPGTTDRGTDYENCMVAKYILELVTDDNIKDFKISSNDNNFGAFDDVILEIERHNNNNEKYALQLKHVNKNKTLSLFSLSANAGNFSIPKYFKSYYYQMKKTSIMDYKVILFTNLKLEVKSDTVIEINMDEKKFNVKIVESNASNIVNTSETSIMCYKFQIEDISCVSSEYQSFFENFYFYTNQANVDDLEKTVQRKFQNIFCCDEIIFRKYVQIINKWSKREGIKEKLDKETMQKCITIYLLSSSISPFSFGPVSENARILQRAAAAFTITVCSRRSSEKISNIWGDAKERLIHLGIKEINRIGLIYEPSWEFVPNVDNLSSEDCIKLLWFMDKNYPLILTESRLVDRAIQLCKDRKYVLIKKKGSDFCLDNFSVFQKLSDLKNHSDIFQDVTTKFKCKLPGHEVSLDYLIRENKEFQDIVTTDELFEMIDGPYVFEDQQFDLPVPYIYRTLSFTSINAEYFEDINHNTLIVVSNVSEEKTSIRKYSNENFYIIHSECSWKKFKEICQKKQAKIAHHFRLKTGELELVGSIGSVSNLEPYCIENSLKEKEVSFHAPNYQNNINIITDEPGMGKSTFLKSLKNNLSRHLWTILFSPTDISKICKITGRIRDSVQLIDFILNLKYSDRDVFHKLLLKLLMLNGKVAYLWDGLDEISDENFDTIINLIYDFSQEISLQWIASRRHLRKFLQNKFNIFPATIVSFDKDEQDRYITERLRNTKNPRVDITNIIARNIEFAANTDILGIPQQIFMLTELFLRDQEKYVNLVNGKLFPLTDLYHHFIEEKYLFFYIEKAGMNIFNNDAANLVYRSDKARSIKNYQKAALMSLFGKEFLSYLNSECSEFIEEIKKDGDRLGFIVGITLDDQKPRFLHESYAEYWSALYFAENYKNIRMDLKPVIFKKKYANVRFFFDCLLAKDSVQHVAVLYKNLETLIQYENEIKDCKDIGGRNLLQLAISWGERYDQFKITDRGNQHYEIGFDYFFHSINNIPTSDKEILEYLVQKCDATERDHLFEMDSLSYAEVCDCLVNILVVIPHYQKLDYLNSKSDNFKDNILFFAIYLGYDGAIKCFENTKINDIRTQWDDALLHTAVKNGHFEVVKLLIQFEQKQKQAKIDVTNIRGETPLHVAANKGYTEIAKLLIESHANIDAAEEDGKTPLHWASENGHYEIVKLLIKSKANVSVTEEDGKTPLHCASMNGHYKITELLIESNADIDVANKDGKTALLWASLSGHCEIAEFLIKSKAHVDIADKDGKTPLHVTSRKGYLQIAELLIRSKANVDVGDKNGETPLHLASWNGHCEIVKLLIESKAKVDATDKEGKTPLHSAAYNEHCRIVELLIESKAHVDISDNDGKTPLHWASCNEHCKIVELLIESKAMVDATDKEGKTPLHMASWNGHYEVAELLIKFHAMVDVSDKDGKTPLNLALQMGHFKIAKLLKTSRQC